MVHKKYSSAVSVVLFWSATTVVDVQLVRSQQTPSFKLPASVAQGTAIRIDGSSSMAAVNEVLKQRFEKQFNKTQVTVAANGVPASIQAVLNGKADLAAIGRPLNESEKAQGLTAVPVGRDKIAILVGADNPFAKSITIEQFARMFRGEIKNWSDVGGPAAPVKFVDRPEASDTREALKSYPVFKQAKFATGATATQLKEDTPQALVSQLGNTGISYATANQVKGVPGAKALPLNGASPSDPRYPFSQALYYVYKGAPSPAVQAFLGFATAPVGQSAIEQAGVATTIAPETAKTAANKKTEVAPDAKAAKVNASAQKADGAAATGAAGTAAKSSSGSNKDGNQAQDSSSQAGGGNPLAFLFPGDGNTATGGAESGSGLPSWLWWLLPIGSGATLLWMLGRSHRTTRRQPDASGATGTFSAPDAELPRDDRFTAPYVEGGFDPLQGDLSLSAGVDARDRVDPGLNLDAHPDKTSIEDRAPTDSAAAGNLGDLGGGALAGGAAWSAFDNRGKLSRVVLKARSAQEVEAFWDIPAEERQAMRRQGGEKLALRLYDVTEIDLNAQPPHSVQQFECDELMQRQRLAIALGDRDYLAEIGYLTPDRQWLGLARSTHVRVPAAPSNTAKPNNAAESAKPFLSGDRDGTMTDSTELPAGESPEWLQRITHRVSDSVPQAESAAEPPSGDATVGETAAVGAAAWAFLSSEAPQAQATLASEFVTSETAPVAAPSIAPSIAASPEATSAEVLQAETTSASEFVTGETAPVAASPEATSAEVLQAETTSASEFVTGETAPVAPSIAASPIAASPEATPASMFVAAETESSTSSVGEGRLVLTPRNSSWAYASWDIPRSLRARIDISLGEHLVLRLYDVTGAEARLPAHYEEHDIHEMALSCDVPIPQADRTYLAEVGYVSVNQEWTKLARSTPVYISAL